MTQSPKSGADTSNFDIHAKNGDDREWSLVGRPSWRSEAFNLNLLKNPRYDMYGSSFFMPEDEELTLFEPANTLPVAPFPYPLFGYGSSLLLFGMMGFLRLNRWAAFGLVAGCIPAFATEMFLGNFQQPNAECQHRVDSLLM